MGTINYGCSDYITLGIKPYDMFELEQDQELMIYIRERAQEYGTTVHDELYIYIEECEQDNLENVKNELEKYDLYYFHIAVKPGYYEGFYLDIECNFIALDGWEDRREAQKEITQIKQFLLNCAGYGLVKCCPGSCTAFWGYRETLTAIEEAIREMRAEIAALPTWRQYERAEYA